MTAGMPREVLAHHDVVVLGCPHVGAAMAVHRAAPGLSLVGLIERAARSSPASRAIEHAHTCSDCRVDGLCPTGARLARAIDRRRRRRTRTA